MREPAKRSEAGSLTAAGGRSIATGGYQRRLVAELADAGYTVAVVNPRQVRDYARGLGRGGDCDDPADRLVVSDRLLANAG
ncbi:MAG: hypothetical protein H0T47_18200 [Planctomycetaceae bacterium]|nr:hypothetical protein [Planctomycetaceae bacterium]